MANTSPKKCTTEFRDKCVLVSAKLMLAKFRDPLAVGSWAR